MASDITHPELSSEKVLKIGVRAIKGVDVAKKTWSETVNVLSQNVKGYRFELIPILGFNEMRIAIKNKKIDFVLTNPLAYIELNKQFGITRILTLNKRQPNGIASTTFAAVIFTRSDRNDIFTLQDLHDKSIMGVHEEAFGGWRMAVRELLNHNFDPHKDSRKVLFSSDNTHQSVVYSVLAGDIDVGTVRTGIIEQLIEQGKIKADAIKILNSHKDKLPAFHSTQHYPEWPFAVMPHVSSLESNNVFLSLLDIRATSAAAIAGKYVNWVAPLDYSEVYGLANELEQRHVTFDKIWNKHWLTIILFLIFVTVILFYTFYLLSINKILIRSEQELSQHRDHLEDVVNIRTEELTDEKEKANSANKAKSVFLSNMSHELRTPLNAILGFSQLLKMEDTENKKTSHHADEIILAGKFLLSLINDILDLASIESGKTKIYLEKVSCSEIVKNSIEIITPLSDKNNITINFDHPSECVVMADRKRLQQICINLLGNAIKYNKQNGSINIVLELTDTQLCKISIKDTGVGIHTEFYDKVFQPFARDQDGLEVIEGTGVGLTITKHLVEQMQGDIGFNSEYGVGSEFWVTLPAMKSQ